jgi:hypothetical protein
MVLVPVLRIQESWDMEDPPVEPQTCEASGPEMLPQPVTHRFVAQSDVMVASHDVDRDAGPQAPGQSAEGTREGRYHVVELLHGRWSTD